MRRALVIVAIAVVAIIVAWQVLGRAGPEADGQFEFVEVERGDIENVISSTGTLSAVGTVEVGTQVSGRLSDVFADFNDNVRKGQVLALIDTTFLAGSVKEARASLMRAESQLALVTTQHARSRDLFERGLVSEADYEDVDAQLASARASVLSAEAALDRARTNLDYAVIRSPISGTVIERSVEPGQTVAASLSAPVLFIIAEDLAEMEIHALVDESDIGQVRVGQKVRFTVEAYIDDQFDGVVRQIWLQPQTIQNVVNYTVVVDAKNDRGLLFPGMTATADFFVDEVRDVLMVPNAALRFQPTEDMMAEFRESMRSRFESMPEGERQAARERMAAREGGPPGAASAAGPSGGGMTSGMFGASDDGGHLWYLDVSKLSGDQYAEIRNQRIGFVFQTYNLLPRTSAIENVELPLFYDHGERIKDPRKSSIEALERVGLGDRLDHLPSELSGGEQQRVALARALVNNPSIILADEPTGNLDSRTSIDVMSVFQELNDQGITILLVTHEPDIAQYTKRIVVMRDGTIVGDRQVWDRRAAAKDLANMPPRDEMLAAHEAGGPRAEAAQ